MELNNLTTTALKAAMKIVLDRDEREDAVSDLIDVIEFVSEKGEEATIGDLEKLRKALRMKNVNPMVEEMEWHGKKTNTNTGGARSAQLGNVHLT